ncbi:MAG: ImmA/IrrE family metallo-endopeptidase [Patescibacteria group bacterium]|jgi:Zn-dependent peptidase ImmA (M78 family)
MDSHTKYIEEIAKQALKKSACKETPVSVEQVAKSFGLEVIAFPFHQKISGVLKKEEGIIAINKNHHPVRQRFTSAHELGHFLLGHGMEDISEDDDYNEIIDDSFAKPKLKEREANLFASALLMPADWVKDAIKKEGMDIDRLAPIFGVSKQAMTIRLLALKLV